MSDRLRLIPYATDLDAEIAVKLDKARREWAGIGSQMIFVESRKTDTERFELVRQLEARATALSIPFDELALLVERREGGGNEPGGL